MAEEKTGGGVELKQELTPWEQHSAVISIPRFDYKAPSSLLEHSHSGFLITCTIKREKSATKEAISILEKHIGFQSSDGFEKSNSADVDIAVKRRRLCAEEVDGEDIKSAESNNPVNVEGLGEGEEENSSLSAKVDTSVPTGTGSSSALSLVKLTRSGLLLFTFSRSNCMRTADILSNVFNCLGSGSLRPPQEDVVNSSNAVEWKVLHKQGLQLLEQVVSSNSSYSSNLQAEREGPLLSSIKAFPAVFGGCRQTTKTYQVGYNRRGIDETEMKKQKAPVKDSNPLTLLDRNECFAVVAGAIKEIAADSVVDLKSPEVVVFVELLPLSGLPQGSLVAAVSVLSHNLVTVKPRLSVKALALDSKTVRGI